MFYQPQFGALSAFSTVAHSNYNALQLSVRQRLREDITFDFNYTYGHSLDNASGLQNSNSYGTAFIVNALSPDENYATSDFDARHIINANWVVGLPVGRGKRFLSNASGFVEQALGGWQSTGIFRWNSGLPIQTPIRLLRLGHKLERAIKRRSGAASAVVADTKWTKRNSERVQRSDGCLSQLPERSTRRSGRQKRSSCSGIHFSGHGTLQVVQAAVGRSRIAVPLGSIQRHQHSAL